VLHSKPAQVVGRVEEEVDRFDRRFTGIGWGVASVCKLRPSPQLSLEWAMVEIELLVPDTPLWIGLSSGIDLSTGLFIDMDEPSQVRSGLVSGKPARPYT
jgi:hypothetical protein